MHSDATSGDYAFDTGSELLTRAAQISRLTYAQFTTIRDLAVEAGLNPQVGAVTAWLAADPQDAIKQLKKPREEVLAAGVTAKVIKIDVLTAPLIRAPENLRMSAHRHEGRYRMPAYTSAEDNSTLKLCLDGTTDVDTAMRFYFGELAKVDDEILANNQYGDDIRANGIRVGGILFPLVIEFAQIQPGIAGWETADSYGRTYFAQDAEGVEAAHVLEWLRTIPANGQDFARHALSKRRAEVLSIAGKVLAGNRIARSEGKKLRRAVMPSAKMVVSVTGKVRLDEVRRRVVAQQHLDRPTPFSPATDWQTRADAVVSWLHQKGTLVVPPGGHTTDDIRWWLDQPHAALATGTVRPDDIAMIAVSSMLTVPKSARDKDISDALRTRGVTGNVRTHARSEVVAHVVCRLLRGCHDLDTRRSAMERALRWTDLRAQKFDPRPPEALLAEALAELDETAPGVLDRALGGKAEAGPATLQLVTRGAFYLICAPQGGAPQLTRSNPGEGKAAEPDVVLQKLAGTAAGLQQLAQAIFDGRRRLPVRRVPAGGCAWDTPVAPDESDVLTAADLRQLAVDQRPALTDSSAAAQLAADSHELRLLLDSAVDTVRRMATRSDSSVPLLEDQGWNDPTGCIPLIDELAKHTSYWRHRFTAVNRQRPADDFPSLSGHSW
ncbi:hypothetical protein ACIRG5_47975 [Lentzea sp. NPDC102401]|uniref:hypothetical protein n=1 Tax=Lentzea sp. NPDC102401 TaxID=3364128 RepID=UPI0038050E0D